MNQFDPAHVGINALKEYLQDLLDRHITRMLPGVCDEIRTLLISIAAELANLGNEHSIIAYMRIVLTSLLTTM